MKRPRLRPTMKSILDYVGEGLVWTGLMWTGYPLNDPWGHPGQLSTTALSKAECAEWATLVERLR